MSKKDIDFGKLVLTQEELQEKVDVEEAVALIHNEQLEKERTKRITIDIPFSLYVDVRTKVVKKEMTLKDYFLGLVTKDLSS
ncbi:MAG: hypothetical protein AAF990_26585 [Bacteroidota bacterium]